MGTEFPGICYLSRVNMGLNSALAALSRTEAEVQLAAECDATVDLHDNAHTTFGEDNSSREEARLVAGFRATAAAFCNASL